MKTKWLLCAVGLVGAAMLSAQRSYGPTHIWWSSSQGGNFPWEEDYDNPEGMLGIVNEKGAVHTEGHAFFEALGTNNRACITCHQPSNAMSVSTTTLQQRWLETEGKDPVFAAFDGSNCPSLPQAEPRSHSLLLNRGLFRIPLAMPAAGADFKIEVLRDPTGCNTDPAHGISVYRRPRMAANLKYVTTGETGEASGIRLMADGREASLRGQAISAVMGHEQAKQHPTEEQLRQIVAFERQVFAAQSADVRGGMLTESEGPVLLGPQNLALGKAGMLGDRAGVTFASWRDQKGRLTEGMQRDFRESVMRGSEVFFSRTFPIPGNRQATCATCHSGKTSTWMDIGTTNLANEAMADKELPLFRITCKSGKVTLTQDPGRAMISGKCEDVGAIVVQQFRGLSARAPYFSNGSARSLTDVIDYYDKHFGIGYNGKEKEDLRNFLKAL